MTRTVLIVEDETEIREPLAHYLRKEGFVPVVASDGEAGFREAKARRPDEDRLTVAPGFIGAYPNVFFKVSLGEMGAFVDAIAAINGPEDYARLLDRFAVRRTSPTFWAHVDELHARARQLDPLNAGLFDLNRLENR